MGDILRLMSKHATLAKPLNKHVTDQEARPNSIVMGLTLGMSWQLAVTVLVPVVGGHLLDAKLHPNGLPVYTLAGLLLALAGMIIVVRRTLKALNAYMAQAETEQPKDV